VPAFVVESAAATLSALTGFAGPSVAGQVGAFADVTEAAFVLAAAVTLLYLALRLRGRPVGPWLRPYLLILFAFWVALGLSQGPGREPTTPRYLFFGSIIVLLIVAARMRGVRPTRTAILVLVAFCSVSLVLNFSHLVRSADSFDAAAADVQAQLGVLELAGSRANPALVPRDLGPPASQDVAVAAGPYLDFVEATGSLGFSNAELSRQQWDVRAAADRVLARAEGLLAVTGEPSPPASADCERKAARKGDSARFGLAEGTMLLRLTKPGAPQQLLVGRFAPPTVPLGPVEAESFVAVRVPSDGASEPWTAQVAASVQVCGPFASG
jgi:hypothetical protein